MTDPEPENPRELLVGCWKPEHRPRVKADIHLNVDGAKVVESVGNLTLLVEAPESAWEQLSALRYVVSVEENADVELVGQTDEQAENPGIKEAIDLDRL